MKESERKMTSKIFIDQILQTLKPRLGKITILLFLTLLFLPSVGYCRDKLLMYLGEVKVLELQKIARVAIGNPKVASNTILPNGQLVLLADNPGITTMHIWLEDGSEQQFDVVVKEKANIDSFRELSKLVAHMPGVTVSQLDDLLIVKGKTTSAEKIQLTAVLAQYKNVLNLTTSQDATGVIGQLLKDVPNVSTREIDDYTVVFGEVSAEYSTLIGKVAAKYPQLLDLTRVQTAIVDKMIYMKVKVMEVNKSFTETLGIKWNTTLNGPSFSFGIEGTGNKGTILNAEGTSDVFTKPGGSSINSGRGYFGIATGVTSIINLAESDGDAVILAEPQLSTRSGGKAEFLAGGEFPIPVTDKQGQTSVEFKKYGIVLNIEPVIDDLGNILAHVETEISTIDRQTVVLSVPGLLSRKTSTDVSLRPKQTLVIAGLVQDMANKNFDKVPWMGDLPVLGPLFRSKDFNNQRTELVIFVTPYVSDVGASVDQARLERAAKIQENFDEIVKGTQLLE